MHRVHWLELGDRFSACRLIGGCLLAAIVAGCGHKEQSHYTSISQPPTVQVIQPEVRKLVRVVGQPSFVEAYERTSVYPKMTAYIAKWLVDIGDKVKKGETLATLFVPELVEDFGTKKATVKLDKERVELANRVVEVADADVKAAQASLTEAKAILAKYQAEVDRWDTEVKRLTHEVNQGVVDPQILLESTNQWKSSVASRDAARATITKAEAELLSKEATLAKAKVDVSVAKADLAVADSEEKRMKAWNDYLTLWAPFDGVIVARNANTFDFVLPSTGDPSADSHSPHLSPSGTAAPIYVVDRTDVVRIFVDIPEQDANYVRACDLRLLAALKNVSEMPSSGRDLVVLGNQQNVLQIRIFDSNGKRVVSTDEPALTQKQPQIAQLKSLLAGLWGLDRISPLDKDRVIAILTTIFGADKIPVGTKASVLVQAYRDEPIAGTVTRTSWALNVKSRTLRAEIDLPNPGGQLLPGMYAYANVIIERPGVHSLPLSALTHSGDRTFCWLYNNGHAERTEIQTGVTGFAVDAEGHEEADNQYIEVTNLQRKNASATDQLWKPFGGSEQVILGDLSILAEGSP
ncbi:MAG: efflux RND transporter periplasmic adaptor subunit, partial [Isosphaeraceae bacterium]